MNKLPIKAILSILGALLYGASPIDLIPDVIPILGLLDDGLVAVILALLAVHYVRQARTKRLQPVPATSPMRMRRHQRPL